MNCYYCDLRMREKYESKNLFFGGDVVKRIARYSIKTKEHLIRKADGGKSNKANIVYAHMYCNSVRGEANPEQHKEKMLNAVKDGSHPLAFLNNREKLGS